MCLFHVFILYNVRSIPASVLFHSTRLSVDEGNQKPDRIIFSAQNKAELAGLQQPTV